MASNTMSIRLTLAQEIALNNYSLLSGMARNQLVAIAVGGMLDRIASDLANQAQSTLASLGGGYAPSSPKMTLSTTLGLQRRYGRSQRAEIRAQRLNS